MKTFTRITVDPNQMGGLPCIRGLRIPVATVVGMVVSPSKLSNFGHSASDAFTAILLPIVFTPPRLFPWGLLRGRSISAAKHWVAVVPPG